MNIGKFVLRFACGSSIDDELSTMTRMSRLRFVITARVAACSGSAASLGAQAAAANTSAPPSNRRDPMTGTICPFEIRRLDPGHMGPRRAPPMT